MLTMMQRAPSPGREGEVVPERARTGFPADGEIEFHFERAFTLQEAADRLGISLRQAEMHVADGTLAAINVGRGRLRRDLRVLDDELERFVEARRVAPTRPAEAPPRSGGRRRTVPTGQAGSFTEAYLNRSIKGRR